MLEEAVLERAASPPYTTGRAYANEVRGLPVSAEVGPLCAQPASSAETSLKVTFLKNTKCSCSSLPCSLSPSESGRISCGHVGVFWAWWRLPPQTPVAFSLALAVPAVKSTVSDSAKVSAVQGMSASASSTANLICL